MIYEKGDWWRFWEEGSQTFYAVPGDRVHCFVKIFSPTDFQDEVQLVWLRREKRSWVRWDAIPLQIRGGRSEGYRGTANKANYSPGRWQVRVVTSDGREMGRQSFQIVNREENKGPRVWGQNLR